MPERTLDCKGSDWSRHDWFVRREVPFWRWLLTGNCRKFRLCQKCGLRGPVYYEPPRY